MLKLGLTAAERRAYERALGRTHTRRIVVEILDLEKEQVLADVSARFLDGQVVVNSDAEVSRSLTLTLLDPDHSINFDTDSPFDGALYADRMIRVTYVVNVEELGRSVPCVVFVGPVTKLARDAAVLNVEAQGKEVLGRGSAWNPLTFGKGYGKVAAFEAIMRERAGETRFSLPTSADRLPAALSLGRLSVPWDEAKKIGSGMGLQAFYSAEGLCTLRTYPSQASFTFTTGDGGNVLSEPSISHVIDNVKNTIVVTGYTPTGAKAPIQATKTAPATHPLSATRLGRNGRPRFLVEEVTNSGLRSVKDAEAYAQRLLDDRLRETVEVSFDALPVPHLEPGDLVELLTDDYSTTFRLGEFSIPLGANNAPPMTVGYTRKTTTNANRIRTRR